MATKICTRCKENKNINKFGNRSSSKDGLNYICKECNENQKKKWRTENPDKYKKASKKHYNENKDRYAAINRKNNLKRWYGLKPEDVEELLKKQNHTCAICGKHESEFKKILEIDHDHKTGKVRGMLCHKCNKMLGLIDDSIDILKKSIEYLGA